jgi:hypothetical protein
MIIVTPHQTSKCSLLFFTGDEFRDMLSTYTQIPLENIEAVEAQRKPVAVAAFDRIEL